MRYLQVANAPRGYIYIYIYILVMGCLCACVWRSRAGGYRFPPLYWQHLTHRCTGNPKPQISRTPHAALMMQTSKQLIF